MTKESALTHPLDPVTADEPIEYSVSTMMPVGLFDQNPAIDVPPAHGTDHCAS